MKSTRREAIMACATMPLAGIPPDEPHEPVYPDDAFSRPMRDRRPAFDTLGGVAPFLKLEERAEHYADQEFVLVGEGSRRHARWRFTNKDMAHNALFLQERIRRAPRAISFKIANRSSDPVSLELQAHEMAWLPTKENSAAVWVLGPRQALGPGEERGVTFPFAGATADKRSTVRYPISALLIVVADLTKGAEYEFHLSSLTVNYDPAPDLNVRSLRVYQDERTARFEVRMLRPCSPNAPMDIEVRRGEWVLWRVRLTNDEVTGVRQGECTVQRTVPWYIAGGLLEAGLVSRGYRAAGPVARFTLKRRPVGWKASGARRLPKVERRLHRGVPTVFVEGRPFNWRGYASYDYVPGSVAEFGASGANCFCVPACAGRHPYQVAAQTWLSPGRLDFGEVGERVSFSLQANPDAMVTIRVNLAMPAWWLQRHVDQLVRVHVKGRPVVWEEFGNTPVCSMASDAWLKDQGWALRELIRYCIGQPWASRLIGIWLMCGTTEEWFAWGCNDGYYGDYSAPMQEAFEAASGRQDVPLPSRRIAPGWDVYPDTADGRAAAAYHAFLSDLTSRTIGRFARIVKEETAGRALVCCFHGYVIELAGEPRQALSGQFGLRRLLDDPNVDMVATVPLLDFRDLSNGYNPYCSATASIHAAGKLFCSENDMFSWLHPVLWHTLYDPTNPRAGAISMHERECANDAVHGTIQQRFSLAATWHHDRGLHQAFRAQGAAYEAAMALDRTPADEVAFVVDDSAFAWTPPETTYLASAHKLLLRDLGRTGAPVSVWLLSDLDRLPRRIRFVAIPAAYAARREDLRGLERLLTAGGRTVWVIGPPGLVDPGMGRWTPEEPARLLGLPIRVRPDALTGQVALSHDGRGVSGGPKVRPRAEGDDEGWLRYADGGCAGLKRALPNGGELIWSGVPVMDTKLIREWLDRARVHCYAPEGFFVHASRDLVAITAPQAGEAQLRWPGETDVTDLLDGWKGAGRDMVCPFRLGQTRLFRVDSRRGP